MTTTQTTGSARSTVELFRDVFERVLNLRDADAIVPYWAEDIVEVFPFLTLRGRREVRDYFAEMFAAMPDFHIEPRAIMVDGDSAFVRWHMTGTFSGGSWMGIEPTGGRLELDGIDHFTLRDGLVAHNFVVFDRLSFAQQMGMLPPDNSIGDKAMRSLFNARTKLGRRLRRRQG